jgi:beta-glucanase (GH16 family)
VRAAADLHRDVHLSAVDWHPDRIVWRPHGTAYHHVERSLPGPAWVFDHPFYLLINLAAGGSLGGAVGPETKFPADLTVDCVRMYEVGT